MTDSILYEADGPVAVITRNRPERLNAMDAAMLDALMQAVTQAEEDDAIRAVVVTGAGRGLDLVGDVSAVDYRSANKISVQVEGSVLRSSFRSGSPQQMDLNVSGTMEIEDGTGGVLVSQSTSPAQVEIWSNSSEEKMTIPACKSVDSLE